MAQKIAEDDSSFAEILFLVWSIVLGVFYRLRDEVHSVGKQVFQFINGGLPLTVIRAQQQYDFQ